MYYLSLLGTILSNRKNLMELRQPNPGASLELHGVVEIRGDSTVCFQNTGGPLPKIPDGRMLPTMHAVLILNKTETETKKTRPLGSCLSACTHR